MQGGSEREKNIDGQVSGMDSVCVHPSGEVSSVTSFSLAAMGKWYEIHCARRCRRDVGGAFQVISRTVGTKVGKFAWSIR